MGLALRLNFVDVVCDDSLKNYWANGKKTGFQFDVRLSYYRGHFLSTIDEIGVKIDGVEVPAENIALSLGEHDVDFTLYFRSPYMALSETEYQSIDSCGSKRLTVED